VTDRLFPSALREVRTDLTKRPAIVGMLALGVILGISGPFGTIDAMSAGSRTLYWITVVVLTYGIGSFISTVIHALLGRQPVFLAMVLSTCVLGLSLTAVLTAINLVAFGMWYETWAEFLVQLGQVTLISAVVETCTYLLRSDTKATAPETTPLLNRLALDKRGALIALGAEDHYVRVTTSKGEELVLMRLSDAVQEVGSTEGLQIHRSHWIALDQIKNVTRKGDRGQVTLSDQTTRPISRGYMSAVRAAGLLPQGRGN